MNLIKKIINISSFRPQLFLTVACGFLLLLFFTIYASSWVSNQQVRQVLIKQGLQISENLARNSRLALLYESPENATNAVQSTLAFPDVVSVSIHKLDKSILYRSEHEHEHNLEPSLYDSLVMSGPQLIFEDEINWQFIAPVLTTPPGELMDEQLFKSIDAVKDHLIGYVVVTSSKERLNATREGILYSNLTIGAFIGFFLLMLLQITIKRLTQPLYSISKIMQEAGTNERMSLVDTTGPLEIQNIAKSYNRMVKTLEERDEKLRNQNDFLEYQAVHEHLTGLINRVGFEQALTLAITESKAVHSSHALCFMDLDKFKIVNDSCGHNAGDELLQNVSEIFKHHIRKDSDTLARVGGDEFAIIFKNCTTDKAKAICDDICNDIKNYRFHWEDNVFSIGVSIGVTLFNENTLDVEDAVSKADNACYIAKERGRGQVYVAQIDDVDLKDLSGETQIASRIIEHLENDKFELYSQLIQPLSEKELSAPQFEILLRMHDEKGQSISPDKFIAAAERYDLMTRIDHWVISNTLRQLNKAKNVISARCLCSINISLSSINDELFIGFLKSELKKYEVPSENICFELTESVVSRHTLKSKRFIQSVHELGCRIVLDDFVSNSSSFSQIKNMNIDYLKIQGDFFKDISNNPVNFAMAKSINEIAHILNIQTIAEHIEDNESLKEVVKLGIDHAQGFLIDKPSPLSELIHQWEQ